MIETFAALLMSHVLADFVFQTGWIANAKQVRRAGAMLLHAAIVLSLSMVAVGAWHPVLLGLTVAHVAIDLAKTFAPRDRLWPFLADQGAHMLTLAAVTVTYPLLWKSGLWAQFGALPALMAGAAGLILAARAGSFAVALLIKPYSANDLPAGLINGGALIGVLERGLIFLFVMIGQPAGIGFWWRRNRSFASRARPETSARASTSS